MMTRGLLITAPATASGKTTVTLALLRHLHRSGVAVASVKVGPDFIDPAFHTAASGRACANLDTWAMRSATLAAIITGVGRGAELVLGEGVMGLFDGAPDGTGSTADLARRSGWPVVLVVDAAGMAASAAALVQGFAHYDGQVQVAGVIFNRVGGAAHTRILRAACAPLGLPVLGCLPPAPELALPDRHLGLVQAGEHPQLEDFLERAAEWVAAHVDVPALVALAREAQVPPVAGGPLLPVLGGRIALARDVAFAFAYPATLDAWRAAGVEVTPFSPLADEAPDAHADAVYLPGGYPELHAGRLAAARHFLEGLRQAAGRGVTLYGECGGYMTLGEALVDAEGIRHRLAGLLPLVTTFAEPQLTLGYREVALTADGPLGRAGTRFRGHDFHFAKRVTPPAGSPLFRARDASGGCLGTVGSRSGTVCGSFTHVIDGVG
jgi:cobyrinic acid a,c-diamide synthase